MAKQVKQNIDPADIHSAADTWSGFIYQGKIALYHVLRLLVDDFVNSRVLQLQLDSLEDFAIVDAALSPVSLHQVKAMKSSLYSTYKEAFEKLEQRKIDFSPSKEAFFHLAIQNEKTQAEIKVLHPTIDLYHYRHGNHYCGLNEIDSCLEQLISEYLNANHLTHLNNPAYLTIARNCLEDLIISQIIAIHANNHQDDGLLINEGAYYFVIPLENFINILGTDLNNKIADETYFLSLTKKLVNIYFTEFTTDLEEDYKLDGRLAELTDDLKLKIDGYLQEINALSEKEFIEFIKNIMPHRSFRLYNTLDFKDNNIDKDGFKLAFLQILFELKKTNGSVKDNFTWNCAKPMQYSPSLINFPHIQKRAICKQIFDNIMNNDVKIPFNSENIITSVINVDSIVDELNNTQKTELQDKKNHITKWGNVSLIALDQVKAKIV